MLSVPAPGPTVAIEVVVEHELVEPPLEPVARRLRRGRALSSLRDDRRSWLRLAAEEHLHLRARTACLHIGAGLGARHDLCRHHGVVVRTPTPRARRQVRVGNARMGSSSMVPIPASNGSRGAGRGTALRRVGRSRQAVRRPKGTKYPLRLFDLGIQRLGVRPAVTPQTPFNEAADARRPPGQLARMASAKTRCLQAEGRGARTPCAPTCTRPSAAASS